ncbi:MAG: (d)CMP kinase [Flavobacteriaceae bacterium]|nr:(d)CMP kinase [Flavobacteriaceae bacterium]
MKKTNKIIIAIDGFSSTGKSTLAKHIAKKLEYIYVDTGAMYRAVSLYAMQNNLISKNSFLKDTLISKLPNIELEFKYNEKLGFAEMFLNGENVENKIRSIEVSNMVSKVAAVSEVREKLVEQQQKMGRKKGVVMDGRDIGTVVFPDAELKIFMLATADKRAKRRFKEMTDDGKNISYQAVLKNVTQRDFIDTTRKDSPLIMAEDAIAIDNSDLNVNETFNKVYTYVKQRINLNK